MHKMFLSWKAELIFCTWMIIWEKFLKIMCNGHYLNMIINSNSSKLKPTQKNCIEIDPLITELLSFENVHFQLFWKIDSSPLSIFIYLIKFCRKTNPQSHEYILLTSFFPLSNLQFLTKSLVSTIYKTI